MHESAGLCDLNLYCSFIVFRCAICFSAQAQRVRRRLLQLPVSQKLRRLRAQRKKVNFCPAEFRPGFSVPQRRRILLKYVCIYVRMKNKQGIGDRVEQ